MVTMPALRNIDEPAPEALPAYIGRLRDAMVTACRAPALDAAMLTGSLTPFQWSAVFARVERLWQRAIVGAGD
jgi:hypothetical protein